MIITFCGHSKIYEDNNLEENIFQLLLEEKCKGEVDFYLGGYGHFDAIAKKSCVQYKNINSFANVHFITPYLDEKYLKNKMDMSGFDDSIYPEIEQVPKKFAIVERNKWMVRQSDLVIAYVNYSWGGAVKTLEYAHKLKKRYINLGTYTF
ncbi:MAG: hypothetical protein HDT29_00965 [Clostridiales bacterium]|nr:hypothetical protein [Clostridiales bacterium]